MSRVVHFELHADDPERAGKFYAAAFGWEINNWGGEGGDYWLVTTGDENDRGIDGGILKREDPKATTWVTVDVDDIDEAIGKVEAAGGSVVVPKAPVPSIGYLAYCTDTEGNVFGMMQSDPEAGM